MAINQNEIVDLLYKKLAYGVAKTNTELERSPTEENIPSPVSSFGNYIWISASSIPATPPASSNVIVERYQRVDDPTTHIELTRNTEVSNNRSWMAKDGNNDALRNWIPPVFGSGYSIKVWAGNPLTGGTRLYPKGSGNNDEFYFDYDSGTLNFIGNTVPVDAFTKIYIEGYRYTGSTDIGSFVADSLGDLLDVNLSGTIDIGQTIVWDGNEWINSMPPGGSDSNFLIVGPQAGEALLYDHTDSKFKNQYLNIENLGNVGDLSLHAGEFLKVNDTADGVDFALFSSLFTAGNKIDLSGSQIGHEPAMSPVDFAPGATITAQDWVGTETLHGQRYAASLQLKLLKDIEMDAEGHVLARVWTDITGELYNYVDKDEWQERWDRHVNVTTMSHSIWDVEEITGIDPQLRNGLTNQQLLIRNRITGDSGATEDVLQAIDHNGLLVIADHIPDPLDPPAHPTQKITEVHATHLLDIDLEVSNPPVAGDVLALQDVDGQGQLRWGYAALGEDQGESNSGISLTGNFANSFDIFVDKPDGSTDLRFRGIKFVDGGGAAITTDNHTWDDGTDPNAPFPLTVGLIKEDTDLPNVDTTLEIGFDPSKIRIYNLSDQMSPGDIGYPTEVLQSWRDDDPQGSRPGSGGGVPSTFAMQYADGWYSWDDTTGTNITDKPNTLSPDMWGAIQGGGGQDNTTHRSRRLRTSASPSWQQFSTPPQSLQQQIDDKLQLKYFIDHMTLGGKVDLYQDPSFGGYFSNTGHYGTPTDVTTSEGLTNPIFAGNGWAHEAKGIIFDASDLKHFEETGTWGASFRADTSEAAHLAGGYGNVDNDWYNDGIAEWSMAPFPDHFHTTRSVIKRHILTHDDNPHGVTHVHVKSDEAHWNANALSDAPLNISNPELGQILKFNPNANNGAGEWYNAGGEAYAGESNIGENHIPLDGNGDPITTGVGYFYKEKNHSAFALVFKGINSSSNLLTVTDSAEVVTLGFDETAIRFLDLDLTDANGATVWPPSLNTNTDVNTDTKATGQVLGWDGAVWSAVDAISNIDLANIQDNQYLTSSITGGVISWVGSDYTKANYLAGSDGAGGAESKEVTVDYSTIQDNEVLAYNAASSSWKAIGLGSVGQANELDSYAGTAPDPQNGIAGDPAVPLAAEGTHNKDGVTLYVKGVKDTDTIVVDTARSGSQYIAFKVNPVEVKLEDLGGSLAPAQIDTGGQPAITAGDLGALSGAAGGTGTLGSKIGNLETETARIDQEKAGQDELDTLSNAEDPVTGEKTAQAAYDKAAPEYTTGSAENGNLETVEVDEDLKMQPYEVGNTIPIWNANKLLNAPIDPSLAGTTDIVNADGDVIGKEYTSNLTLLQEGKYLKWDGTKWGLGGGGEIVEGEHGQFGFFWASNPLQSTATNIIKPTGGAFNFYEGNASIGEESKIGIHTSAPPEALSIAGFSPCLAVQQISSTNYEPEELIGWGKLYARTAIGGISAESKIVLHFDGPHNANSFINDGIGEVYFLPMHDADGNGTLEYNNVKTVSDKYVYGDSSGFFPGGFGDYIAGNNSTDITIAMKPFDLDFWMMPLGDYPLDADGNPDTSQPRNDPSGKRYLVGQYAMSESRWHLSVDFDSATHDFEFFYRDYDSYNATFTDYTITLQNPLSHQLQDGTWYHVVFQRYQVDHNGVQKDMWELHIADGAGGTGQGAPAVSATGEGIPHQMVWERTEPPLLIQSVDGELIIGHANRKGDEGGTGLNLGFRGYMDEFRFQIGSFINWTSLSVFRTFLLPYDTGQSSLIFKDSGGSYDLLNAAGVVRKLLDQDGDTRVEVDFNDVNDNTIRFRANGNEVATITKDGLNFVGGGTIARLDDHLNTNNVNAVVSQRAIKQAIDNISTSSIVDSGGQTYVHTEQTLNDYTIRMVAQGNEQLAIDANGIDIKSQLKLSGVSPAEGDAIIVDANGDLTWGTVAVDGIAAGGEGSLTTYTTSGTELGPATGLSWNLNLVNPEQTNLQIKGKQRLHYVNIDQDDLMDDTADVYIQHYADGNDADTTCLLQFDSPDSNGRVDSIAVGGDANGGMSPSSAGDSGADTNFKMFGASSWRSGPHDSNGDPEVGTTDWGNSNHSPGGTSYSPGNDLRIHWDAWTTDFWIMPTTSYAHGSNGVWSGNAPQAGDYFGPHSQVFKAGTVGDSGRSWGFYVDQSNGNNPNLSEINMYVVVEDWATVTNSYRYAGKLSVKEWTHIAIMKKNSNLYVFKNGFPIYFSDSVNWLTTSNYHFAKFAAADVVQDFCGYLDEFRHSKVARYDETAGFVPRDSRYGARDTQLIVEDKSGYKTDVMQSDPHSIYTTDIIHGNYLIKGQGESSKRMVESAIYETGDSLYIPSGSLVTGNWNAYTNGWTPQRSFISTTTGVSSHTHSLVYGDQSYDAGGYDRQDSLAPNKHNSWKLHNKNTSIRSKFGTMGVVTAFSGVYGSYSPPGFSIYDGCIEFWIRSNNTDTGTGEFMRFSGDSSPYLSCSLSFSNGEGSFSFSGNNSGHGHSHEAYPADQSNLKYAADGEWHHFAWVRNGTFSGFFIDGALKASTTMSNNYDIKDGYYWNRWNEDTAGRQKIGWTDPLVSQTYLCDLEITIGHSKYGTTNFTPPLERNQETLIYTSSLGSITNVSTVSRAFESGDIPTVSSINNGANMPTGSLVAWAGSSAPTGWLSTDGSDISRTTYAGLFSVIGTTYGAGDGSTTFGLPNFNSPAPWIIKT